MQETGLPFLTSWQNFYIIIGSAAATLTGLMFIVVTLMAGIESHVSTLNAAITAYNTPTIVHFGVVLLLAGLLSAPWQSFLSISLVLGLSTLGVVIYFIRVMQRMRQVPGYQTRLKDWLWYSIIPLLAYLILLGAAVALPANPSLALYIISAVVVVLLFIGIRNAWDLVTYLAVERSHPDNKNQEEKVDSIQQDQNP